MPQLLGPLGSLLIAALLWFAAPFVIERKLEPWELAGSATLAYVLIELWRRRRARQQRQQIEQLRDSALW